MYLPCTLLDVGKRLATKIDENYLTYGGSILLNEKKEKTTSHVSNSEIFDKFTLTYRDFILQPSSFWTRKLWQNTGELNIDHHYVLDWDWYITNKGYTSSQRIMGGI